MPRLPTLSLAIFSVTVSLSSVAAQQTSICELPPIFFGAPGGLIGVFPVGLSGGAAHKLFPGSPGCVPPPTNDYCL